jgi:dipeptidyl aminopeptidase/acylaminoacyl peptidase
VNVATGDARELTPHKGNVLIDASSLSPDGKTLLIGSNEKDGYGNVALLDLSTLQKRWISDTQWDAGPGSFSPSGDLFTWSLNADGRTSIHFTDAKTQKEVPHVIPEGLNYEIGNPTPFTPDGRLLFVHQDSTHAPNYMLGSNGAPTQITHVESPRLRNVALPLTQLVHYASFDGKIISAFLAIPFRSEARRHSSADRAAARRPHWPGGRQLFTTHHRAGLPRIYGDCAERSWIDRLWRCV